MFSAICMTSFLVCSGSFIPMQELGVQVVKPATEAVEAFQVHPAQADLRLRLIIEDSSEVDICTPSELFRTWISTLFQRFVG